VVTRSSNPEGRSLQSAITAAGLSVEDQLLAEVAGLNAGGLPTPGTVGVVIGATLEPTGFDLGDLGGVVLAPGFGVQGGTADSVRRLFGGCAPGTVLPSASRSLLSAGPDVGALRAKARAEVDALATALA
jgi:orotidine-5'-phosphate decarboxylase